MDMWICISKSGEQEVRGKHEFNVFRQLGRQNQCSHTQSVARRRILRVHTAGNHENPNKHQS